MNKDNLEQLIHDYMEKYDLLNDAEHDEIYKWNAVNHFQKYWDLDTDEFGEMFKQAILQSHQQRYCPANEWNCLSVQTG